MGCYDLTPKGIYIEITSYCNRLCPYCYNNSTLGGTKLSKSKVISIFDNCRLDKITISGGEPFFHPDIIEIIEYANSKNIKLHIISNLTNVSIDNCINILLKHNTLQITLDSVDPQKNDNTRGFGSYDLVKNLLIVSKKHNLQEQIKLRCNISKANKNELQKFVDFALNYGVKNIEFAFLIKSGRAQTYPYLLDYTKDLIEINSIISNIKNIISLNTTKINITYSMLENQIGCVFFKNGKIDIVPRIDAHGNVYLCQLFDGEENAVGNINNASLDDILSSSEVNSFIDKIRNRKNNNPNCVQCVFSEGCMCGCPAMSLMNTTDLEKSDDQCGMIKFFYKEKLMKRI